MPLFRKKQACKKHAKARKSQRRLEVKVQKSTLFDSSLNIGDVGVLTWT